MSGQKRPRPDPDARAAHELVANGPSQIERARAIRVRDANRPSVEDLAEAEESVQIVRRHWKPQK